MPDLAPFVIAGLSTGAVYVLAGVGLVVLYRASGVLNLAQGALGALSAMLAWQIADSGGPQWVGWIAAVTASTALALLYGRLIAPRLATSDPIVRAVATLGFALIILGFCEFIWGEWPRTLPAAVGHIWVSNMLGVRVAATRAIAFALGLAVTDWNDPVSQFQPPRFVDACARQRPRNQWPSRRSGPASRCLGLGDFRRALRRQRDFPRQYGAAAGDTADLHGDTGGRGCDPGSAHFADGRNHRRSRHRRCRGGSLALSRNIGVSFRYAFRGRWIGIAVVPARRSDAKPHGPVSVSADKPSATKCTLAGASRRHRPCHHHCHRSSVSCVGVLAQDIHRQSSSLRCAASALRFFMPNWVWCRCANTHCSALVAGLPCGFIMDFIFRLKSTFS